MDICFLVQLTDGGGRNLAAPEGLSNILHTPDRYAGQVHLNQCLFHTALPAAIPLNNSSLEGDSLEFWHLESNVSGSRSEVAAVVAAAVALSLLVTLVPGRLGQLLCLGFQKLVECFLYAAAYEFLELPLDYFFVQLYNLLGHGLPSPFRMVCRDFILPECCKPCPFLSSFQFAKIIVPYLKNRSKLCIACSDVEHHNTIDA